MRICYLNPDLGIQRDGTKGAAAHLRGLITAFEALGHEVSYLAPSSHGAGGDIAAPEPGLYAGLPKVVDKRVARALRHIWANAGVEAALEQHIASTAPDLIYERCGPFAVAGAATAARLGVPHILEVNAPLAREGATYRKQALGEAAEGLEQAAYALSGAVLTVSAELRAELAASGVKRRKLHVLPNGVDTSMFQAEGPVEMADPEGRLTFGFIGGLRPWHGVAHMAEAFAAVAEPLDARLLVVGDGPERPVLEALQAQCPGRVVLTGAVAHDRAPALMRAMDVALAPYPAIDQFYYSPLKILEYMATGRPIIASRIGQVESLLGDGAGVLVPPGDTAALADAMLRLGHDPDLRAALGAEAAKQAHEQHSWTDRAQQILSIAGTLGAG